jgi:quercetin dioxygenase-like cupin family protein
MSQGDLGTDPAHAGVDTTKVPYRHPQPAGMVPDLVLPGLLQFAQDPGAGDSREWVPLTATVFFKPILLNVSHGYYANLLRVTRGGVLSRHRHGGAVHALVLKGRWHYLEHDWVAEAGSYAFEPPGETHTLVVPEDCEEMVTYFIVSGSLTYVDPDGRATGYDDVFTRLAICADHFERVGLGRDYVRKFVR